MLTIRPLTPLDGREVYEMLQEMPAEENGFVNSAHGKSWEAFQAWLAACDRSARQQGLVDGWKVPTSTFWLYEDGRPVGFGKVRHMLTDALRAHGGHAGYAIRPTARGRGLGGAFVALLREEARKLGVPRLLLTVQNRNVPSIRAALRAGAWIERITDERHYLWIETDGPGWPDRATAEALLREAEALNPGPWGDHSRVTAKCAEIIARRCGMDADRAYVLGLTHDIGRRFGVTHLRHVVEGYAYMAELGYPAAARVCLTHSFSTRRLSEYVGRDDVTPEQRQILEEALAALENDDYDCLIQLCDAIAMPGGAAPIEERMGDVKRRYGMYDPEKWNRNLALKAQFSARAGQDIEALTAGVRP